MSTPSCVGVGSGGTLTGIGRYMRAASPKTEMVLADPLGSILAPLIETGVMGTAGSWAVEGIGEDFVPPVCDLSLVKKAYSVDDPESFSRGARAAAQGGHPGRLVVRHAARGGFALLPRAERAQARRHPRLRQRRQIPVEGVQRRLHRPGRLARARAHRHGARRRHQPLRRGRRDLRVAERNRAIGLRAHARRRHLAAAGDRGGPRRRPRRRERSPRRARGRRRRHDARLQDARARGDGDAARDDRRRGAGRRSSCRCSRAGSCRSSWIGGAFLGLVTRIDLINYFRIGET